MGSADFGYDAAGPTSRTTSVMQQFSLIEEEDEYGASSSLLSHEALRSIPTGTLKGVEQAAY